ncbi:diacylglycerol kinase theta-like [Corticium candelabrum]|uniref:diacylglycerol kinase theta-like n=1 Tax=Corticium candelabrum TaxID=121492 RepID=UPI002E271D4B|nr:diacylglycerol kinase theta-like [Corticium candelabrum]
MLWGFLNQGNICRICNFVTHDRCMSVIRTPCSAIAASLVKNPVAHTWSKAGKFRKEFCSVCRRRLEDNWAVRCEVCYYHVHEECYDLAVNDCRNCATYSSNQDEGYVLNHHWREGGVPPGGKCVMCNKDCGTNEFLSSVHCSWCRRSAHSGCSEHLEQHCDMGVLKRLSLPRYCCSLPRIKLSTGATHEVLTTVDKNVSSSTEKNRDSGSKDQNSYKVCDSSTQQPYKVVPIHGSATAEEILAASLKQFQICDNVANYCLVQVEDGIEKELQPLDVPTRSRSHSGSSLTFCMRARNVDADKGVIRVYSGMQSIDSALKFKTVNASVDTSTEEIIRLALNKMGLKGEGSSAFSLVQVTLHDGVQESVLPQDAHPWQVIKAATARSLREAKLMRFYLRRDAEVSYSISVGLYVGGMPKNKPEDFYERSIKGLVGTLDSDTHIGPVYPSFGCMFMEFNAPDTAARMSAVLQQTRPGLKQLKVFSLPHIEPHILPEDIEPLLIFVNKKSGGGYGEELYLALKRLVNPLQVFNLGEGGPLPGLHVFRFVHKFRILICGGDGTFGWVLTVLDEARQNMACKYPPSALLPLGTGNDLSRVLRWGSGYGSTDESLLNYLIAVDNAEFTSMDRWTVCVEETVGVHFGEHKTLANRLKHLSETSDELSVTTDQRNCHTNVSEMKQQFEDAHRSRAHTDQMLSEQESPEFKRSSKTVSVSRRRDGLGSMDSIGNGSISGNMRLHSRSPNITVLNNYFGIGIDADITLGFHKAREEAPEKFSSRFHNKGVYVRLSLSKMISKGNTSDLVRRVIMECDGKVVRLPDVEGIIVLNIGSWGSGADLWGSDRDDRFLTPAFNDGFIEVVGVNGVMHMAQIQGGLRTGIRLAQCSHVKFTVRGPIPLQVDGEPWMQDGDCTIVITRCSEQARMLMKCKKLGKRSAASPSLARSHGIKHEGYTK